MITFYGLHKKYQYMITKSFSFADTLLHYSLNMYVFPDCYSKTKHK